MCRDQLGHHCNHEIRLHLFSIATPGVDENTALRNAMRVYGQHRIRLRIVSAQSLALSTADQLTLNVVDGACQWNVVSDEQRRVHHLGDTRAIGPKDVRIYWVHEIREPQGNVLAGCAGHAPAKPAVMVSALGSQWTMAHELGHVLLGPLFAPVHAAHPTNIMFSPSAAIISNPPTFNNAQLEAIHRSPFCQQC